MSTTTTEQPTSKVKLSCNHVINVDGTATAGNVHQCPRCTASANGKPRHRSIRTVLSTPPFVVTANAADQADDFVEATALAALVDLPTVFSRVRGLFNLMSAEALEAAAADLREHEERPEPEEPFEYTMEAANAEWKAVKAWRAGGQVGDKPSTRNLDAMTAAHAAGKPRSGRKPTTKKGTGTGRTIAPRRREANEAQATKGFGGRTKAAAYTEAELDAYIRQVRAEHPDARRNDELEYAYWVVEIKVSRARWYKAWAATDA